VTEPDTENQIQLEENGEEPAKDVQSEKMEAEINEVKQQETNTKDKTNPFFEGKIASIVFKKACEEFPGDFEFILEFWKVYRQFPDTKSLQDELCEFVREHLTPTSETRSFLSRVPLLDYSVVEYSEEFLERYKLSIQSFDNDIKEDPSPEMFAEYSSFFHQLLFHCADNQIVYILVDDFKKVFEKAKEYNALNESLFTEWVNFMLSIGELEKANEISSFALERYKNSLAMIKLRFQTQILSHLKHNSTESLLQNLSELLASVLDDTKDESELFDIWITLKNYFVLANSPLNTIMRYYKKLLIRNPRDVHLIKEDALRFILLQFGVEDARTLFKESRNYPPTKIALYEQMIQIEMAQVEPSESVIRELFEQSTNEKDAKNYPALFLHFVQQELQNNNLKKVQGVYWKAKKTLCDFEEFEKMYETLTK